MKSTIVSSTGPRRGLGLLVVVFAAAGIAAAGCKPNVEKLRKEQDDKIGQDRRAALAEYKAQYEAKPQDPVAAYLYTRVVDELETKEAVTNKLMTDHPNFAWGYVTKRWLLRERGEYDTAAEMGKKAAALEPDSPAIKEIVSEDRDLVVAEAVDFDRIWDAAAREAARGKSPEALFTDLNWIEEVSGAKRTRAPGYEFIAATSEADDGDLIVRLFMRNTSATEMRLDHLGNRQAVCFGADGARSKAIQLKWTRLHGKRNCMFCLDDVAIAPNDAAVPHAFFEQRPKKKLVRCVFNRLPRDVVLVKAAPR